MTNLAIAANIPHTSFSLLSLHGDHTLVSPGRST